MAKSYTNSIQHDVPEPSKSEKRIWKPLADCAKIAVLSNEPNHDNRGKKNRVIIKHAANALLPDGWPFGLLVKKYTDGSRAKSYNAEAILLWLWERKLADKNAGMLYSARKRIVERETLFAKRVDVNFEI